MKLAIKMPLGRTAQKQFAKWSPFLNEVEKIYRKAGKKSINISYLQFIKYFP